MTAGRTYWRCRACKESSDFQTFMEGGPCRVCKGELEEVQEPDIVWSGEIDGRKVRVWQMIIQSTKELVVEEQVKGLHRTRWEATDDAMTIRIYEAALLSLAKVLDKDYVNRLEQAVLDLLDGEAQPHDIVENRGLNQARAEDLSSLYARIRAARADGHH